MLNRSRTVLLLSLVVASGCVESPETPNQVSMDQVGAAPMALVTTTRTLRLSRASVQPGNGDNPGAIYTAGGWHFMTSGARVPLYFPLPVAAGDTINAWGVWIQKLSPKTTSIVASLVEQDSATGSEQALGFIQSAEGSIPTLGSTGLAFPVGAAKSYSISIYDTTGSILDAFTDAELQVTTPSP